MTYPDRELASDHRRLIFWLAVVCIIVTAFILQSAFKDRTCISAMTLDSAGTVVSTPVECSR